MRADALVRDRSQRFRRDGIPASLRDGSPIEVAGRFGFELVNGERRTLVWTLPDDGPTELVIIFEATNVDREALLTFAESFG